MKKTTALLFGFHALVQSVAWSAPERFVGELKPLASGNYVLVDGAKQAPVNFSEVVRFEAKSLLGKVSTVEVLGYRQQDGTISASQVPTIRSANKTLVGQLIRTVTANQESFTIDGVPAVFGRTKKIDGTEFDEQSRIYFHGKKVRAFGVMKEGTFEVQSLVRADVFTADLSPLVDPEIPAEFVTAFDRNPIGFVTDLMHDKFKSPSPHWFRKTMFADPAARVKAGDPVLLISASGGQGDNPGSINGHIAAGLGYVGADLQIQGEMFNVYVTNEKEIVPGNIHLVDYFGHLISGQQNYRPTYTMVLYGIPEEKILKVKAELDRFHPLFREGTTKITSNKNCATLSVQALADIGLYGVQRNGHNGEGSFTLLSTQKGFPPEQTILDQVKFISKTKRAEFMPGPAFVSLLQNLQYLNEHEVLHITRADFIFGGQTPSQRLTGRAPTKGMLRQVRDQILVRGARATGVDIAK